ncbi:hypothetical protein SLE2022_128830 [Rubroshorea leprosula]
MSDQVKKVIINSKLTTVSSRPVEPGKTHPLSPLDLAMSLHTLHLIFYYEKSPFRFFDLDPWRVSLSEVLSLYPPVTGRLARSEAGEWEVRCNDAGVRILRANVGVPMDEWLRSAHGSEEKDLIVREDMPENPSTWSPFLFQISEFEGGGVAIGLSCPHMQADITTLVLIIKSWTEAHRQQLIRHPPIYPRVLHGRAVPSTSVTSTTAYHAAKSSSTGSQTGCNVEMVTVTFKFSDSVIRQCLLEIQDQCPDATPFDMLAALFWTRVALLKAPKDEHSHKYSLKVCIDFRRLLKEPLSYGYFGNALYFCLLSLGEEDMFSFGGLGHVAGLVHRHVAGLGEEDFLSVVNWLESQKGAPPFRMYGPELTCVSLEHMVNGDKSLMYSAAFESNAKPSHVSCHVGNFEGEGLIMVMPSPEEGLARTVMVTLPDQEGIAKLCEDQAILHLKPTMLFTGRL